MHQIPPVPANEMDRLLALSDFDLDYSNLNESLKDLTRLAAKVAGTSVSLVNLIDSYTQWSVANFGLDIDQMRREDSVCQYTILQDNNFEVKDLSADDRFKDKFYVVDEPLLKYYFGIPLNANGYHIGALCVLDRKTNELSPEKEELLHIIADEVVTRLKTLKTIESLQNKVEDVSETQRRLAHDIRGPLGGIIGLAHVMAEQGEENNMDEVLEFVQLIYKSGKSILELADEILGNDLGQKKEDKLNANEYTLLVLKEKLLKLYGPQARTKKISLEVNISPDNQTVPFSKNKLLQIIGNLVSNAIKFTGEGGTVTINLNLKIGSPSNMLEIIVRDTGMGMGGEQISSILDGKGETTSGTGGEQGYGFGLALVKHLVEGLNGTINITSELGEGTTFHLYIPQGLPR